MDGDDLRIKAVLDTGVVPQAALSDMGSAFRALLLLEAGAIAAFVSPPLRSEYEDVLTRPTIREKNPALTEEHARAMLRRLDESTFMVLAPRRYVEYPRDPDDGCVLDLAIEVRADYLVSRDKDLLALEADRDFRGRYPFLHIVDPPTLLRDMAHWKGWEKPRG